MNRATQFGEKQKNNRKPAAATGVSQKVDGEANYKFVDRRPEAVRMLKLQEIANNSIKNTIQPKWIKTEEDLLKWDGLLDGIQWYQILSGENSGKMYYTIADPKKVKPGLFEAYNNYQKTPMPRAFWEAQSAFGDIYKNLDPSIIAPAEAKGDTPLTTSWFGVNPESMKGIWLERILSTPYEDIDKEFRTYLASVYGDDVLIKTDEKIPLQGHIEKVIGHIKDAKKNIGYVEGTAKTNDKAKELMNYHIAVITRLVPTIPDSDTRILGNIGDLRKDKESQGGSHKLVLHNGVYHLKNREGTLTLAKGAFVFVVPVDTKEVLLGKRSDGGHTVISHGGDVYFAGQMELNNGALDYWNNDTGHYRTPKEQIEVLNKIGLAGILPEDKYKPVK